MGKKNSQGGVKGALNFVNGCRGFLSASLNDQRTDRETLNTNMWENARPEARISLTEPEGEGLPDLSDFATLYLRDEEPH